MTTERVADAECGLQVDDIGFVQLLVWWIATKIDHLKVTDDEIIWTHGLLSKQYTEINMSSVRTVRVAQSLLQRIMNAGDVLEFLVAGACACQVGTATFADPLACTRIIDDLPPLLAEAGVERIRDLVGTLETPSP